MKKTKILIIVEGGIVQQIMSTDPKNAEIVVIDYDDQNWEEPVIIGKPTIEKIKEKNVYDMYGSNLDDKDDQFVHKALKKMKF